MELKSIVCALKRSMDGKKNIYTHTMSREWMKVEHGSIGNPYQKIE